MMTITLKTLNSSGEAVNDIILNNGQANVVQAQSGERFQLIDDATGFAPENIQVKRVGSDLHVAFEGQTIDQPGLILEGYYETAGNGTNNILVGLHENGHIYPYVPETAQTSEAIHQLADNVVSTQAIGGSLTYAGAVAFPLWPLALLPLAGLALAAGGGGGSKGGSSPATPTTPAATLPEATLTGESSVNEGVGTLNYTVMLNTPATQATTFTYTITHGTTDDNDFSSPLTGTVTIPAGAMSANIAVAINNDDVFENSEAYTVKISNPQNATIVKDSVTTNIWDNGTTDGTNQGTAPNNDDDRPAISIDGASSVNEGVQSVQYTVSLDKANPNADTTVEVIIKHGTTESADFTAGYQDGDIVKTITIPAGQTSVQFDVAIANDNTYEGKESYTLSLENPSSNAQINPSKDSVTTNIWDNGTTDGTNKGTAPNDDDDRATPQLAGGNASVSITEGEPAIAGKFTIEFTDKAGNIDPTAKLQSITLANTTLGVNQLLNASSAFPIAVHVDFTNGSAPSLLSITGFDANTGVISYTYESGAQDHTSADPLSAALSITATSTQGKTATVTGTFNLEVKDSEPTAQNDTNTVDQDKSVSGNVISNDTYVDAVNITSTTGKITGKYGELELKADGTYTYTANNAKALAEGVRGHDKFDYTITDQDGDPSSAELVITVMGKNDAPEAKDGTSQLYEKGSEIKDANNQAPSIQLSATDPDNNSPNLTYKIESINGGNPITYTHNKTTETITIAQIGSSNDYSITASSLKGTTGTLHFDPSTGKITITGDSVFDVLPEGTTIEIPIEFSASDGKLSSNIATHTIKITGENDKATLVLSAFTADLSLMKKYENTGNVVDKDTGEGYLKKLDENTIVAQGAVIEGKYGTYVIKAAAPASAENYAVSYEVDLNNVVVKALGKNGIYAIHDYFNITSVDGLGLNLHSTSASSSIVRSSEIAQTAIKAATDAASANDDAFVISGDLSTNLNTLAGDDVVYVKGETQATVQLGVGNDYFFSEKALTNSANVQGGDGNDTFTLFDKDNKGTIDGGAGKDTLVLSGNNEIGTSGLNIKGIEVIDTRSGLAGSDNNMRQANTIKITEEALLNNGEQNLSIFATTDDTINIDVADPNAVKQVNNVYTYTTSGGNTYTITDELNIGINFI